MDKLGFILFVVVGLIGVGIFGAWDGRRQEQKKLAEALIAFYRFNKEPLERLSKAFATMGTSMENAQESIRKFGEMFRSINEEGRWDRTKHTS